MNSIFLIKKAMFIFFILFIVGCSNPESIVKKGTIPINPSITVGDAFNKYKYFYETVWLLHNNNWKKAPTVEFRGKLNPNLLIGMEDSNGNELTSDLINYFLSRVTSRKYPDNYTFMYVATFAVDVDKKTVDLKYSGIKFSEPSNSLEPKEICNGKELIYNIYNNEPQFLPIFNYLSSYKAENEERELKKIQLQLRLEAAKERAIKERNEADNKAFESKRATEEYLAKKETERELVRDTVEKLGRIIEAEKRNGPKFPKF